MKRIKAPSEPQWVKDMNANRPKWEDVESAIKRISKDTLLKIAALDPYDICTPASMLTEGLPDVLVCHLSHRHEEAPNEPGVHLLAVMEVVARVLELREFERYIGQGKKAG